MLNSNYVMTIFMAGLLTMMVGSVVIASIWTKRHPHDGEATGYGIIVAILVVILIGMLCLSVFAYGDILHVFST